MSTQSPIDVFPAEDREQVAPESIIVGDEIFDPHRRRWLKVSHISIGTIGHRQVRGPWHTEVENNEWAFYYFAEEDWERGSGAREDRLVVRRKHSAQNLEKLRNTRAATGGTKPRHPNGPAQGFGERPRPSRRQPPK